MRRILSVLVLALAWAGSAGAHGLLIPEDRTLPPLAMVNHRVQGSVCSGVSGRPRPNQRGYG